MDLQLAFNIALAIIAGLAGWFMKFLAGEVCCEGRGQAKSYEIGRLRRGGPQHLAIDRRPQDR